MYAVRGVLLGNFLLFLQAKASIHLSGEAIDRVVLLATGDPSSSLGV